jgi:hypothetical protein
MCGENHHGLMHLTMWFASEHTHTDTECPVFMDEMAIQGLWVEGGISLMDA